MKETEWPASKSPGVMLSFVCGSTPIKMSERKRRLFAVACCRQVWSSITNESCRRAIEVAERFADGLATRKELSKAEAAADAVKRAAEESWNETRAENYTWNVELNAARAACNAASKWALSCSTPLLMQWVAGGDEAALRASQAHLIRDVIDNPFRPAFPWREYRNEKGQRVVEYASGSPGVNAEAIDSHLRWKGIRKNPQVATLAQAAYDRLDPDAVYLDPVRLSVLADALEEEGCSGKDVVEVVEYCNAFMFGCEEFDAMDTCTHKVKKEVRRFEPHPLLAHLRSPGPHVRGCWAVDAVLGLG